MVTWHDNMIKDPPIASEDKVRAAERELRVAFPADYLAVARAHQGARPEPANVTLPDGAVTAVGSLLHFEDAPFYTNIVAAMSPVEDVVPKGVVPFAEDIGGDLFCFNFRDDFDRPTVSFWSVDSGLVPIAGGFTEFVGMLHD